MSNQKNKILPYAQSAIEGQNIQSYAEYSGSTERQDGVKTGIANGDNFNRFAKQVSIMCASLAEYIVNNTDEGDLTDNLSVDQIATLMEKAIIAKQQKIEFMTQEDYDGITPDPKTLYMIESEPFPNVFAKSLNGVAPDGTGDIKYQIVKTVNTKAPDSNGNVQLEFTFSPNINTGLVGYPLSVTNGGTGTNDGFNFANYINFAVLAKKIGFEIGGTIEDFVSKLPNTCTFTTLAIGNQLSGILYNGLITVKIHDHSFGWIRLERFVDDTNLGEAIAPIKNKVFSGWKIIRNNNGTIPASLGGVLTKYENSNGTWTETLLETGEIMLEGFGKSSLMRNSNYNTFEDKINLPKRVNILKSSLTANTEISSAYLKYIGSVVSTNILSQQLSISIAYTENIGLPYVPVYWYFRGILSQ